MSYLNKIQSQIKKLNDTGFFHIFGSTVINKILGFVSNFFIVRMVSKIEYGTYTSALNILSFFLLVNGLGTLSSVLQLCSENAKEPIKRQNIFQYGSTVGIFFNLILSLTILISSFLFSFPIEGVNHYLLLLSFLPAFEIVNEFQKIFFRSKLDNKSYAYSNTIGSVNIVLFSIMGSYLYGAKGLIFGRYLATALTILITNIALKAPIFSPLVKLVNESKQVFYKISMISMLNNSLSQLLHIVDIFIIGLLLTNPNIVADYKVAVTIPTALSFLPSVLVIYIYPYFSANKDNKSWLENRFRKLILISIFFNGFITLTLIMLARPITLIFGEEYLSSIGIFKISMISYFFNATFRTIAGNLLVTQRKLKFNFWLSLSSGILNVTGNYFFIKQWGAIGAAWTTLLITAFSGIISTVYYAKIIHSERL